MCSTALCSPSRAALITVFGAYAAYTDQEIGRVIQAVEDLGKLDNTLIIYISGDNGCSAEGSTLGTPNEMAAIQGVNMPVAEQLKFYDAWGSEETTPHMAVGWRNSSSNRRPTRRWPQRSEHVKWPTFRPESRVALPRPSPS